jgi:hypothetical protein
MIAHRDGSGLAATGRGVASFGDDAARWLVAETDSFDLEMTDTFSTFFPANPHGLPDFYGNGEYPA